MREIDGTLIAPTTEEEATLAALNSEADDLEEKWANEDCVPDEVNARLEAIDVEIGALVDRPISFDPADMAHAGAFMSIEVDRSEEHTSELQSLMRISYAVFCLKQKTTRVTIMT